MKANRVALVVGLIGACALVTLTVSSAASHAAGAERGGTIAFLRFGAGPRFGGRLFVVRPDGSGLRPVTPLASRVYAYAWSPDGGVIAYIDDRFSLWLVRPDGSGRRLLLPSSRLQSVALSWSPDGTRIAITTKCRKVRCSTLRLYVVSMRRGQAVRLPAGKHIGYGGVSWSPRGDQIYYGDGGICAIRPDGTGRRKISPVGSPETLSADGAQFVFGVVRYRSFSVVNADGTGYHVVTTRAYTEYGEAWSPLGHRILYGRADRQGIDVIGADGRNDHRVTRDAPPRAVWSPFAWGPDGGSIVYDTGTYTNTDLYVIGADGRDKVRLTHTPDVDLDPTWVPVEAPG